MDHHRDPVHDAPACHFPREIAAAHFADDDVIGAVPQGMADQVADRDRAVLQPARLEADAVRGVVQLRMAWCPPLEGLESSSAIPTRTPQTSATDVR